MIGSTLASHQASHGGWLGYRHNVGIFFAFSALIWQFSSAFISSARCSQHRNSVINKSLGRTTVSSLAATRESASAISNNNEEEQQKERESRLAELFHVLESTPANAPTSPDFTKNILQLIENLEQVCPTPEKDVMNKLGGTWELLWTAQDRSSEQFNRLGPLLTWINPLEDQSYSNNPNGAEGRLNPVLPRAAQDQLERLGLIKVDEDISNIKSTQSVDLQRRRVRNVVTFAVPSFPATTTRRASLTVDIAISPDKTNLRRVQVKFQACRIVVPKSPIDINIPLGLLGPTGWLQTNYIDDNVRITRGHKGSVFVLKRPSPPKRAEI